jgi:PKD repeat protein
MKKALIIAACFLACISCKKETVADFEISGTTNVGEKLRFINHSENSDTYHWDFGDGVTSQIEMPTHTYVKPGDYSIILTVTGGKGSSTAEKNIKIGGSTFSFMNLSSVELPLFITFSLVGSEIVDYQPNGALLVGKETVPIITTRSRVLFAIDMNDSWLFSHPYYITGGQHNSFTIYDTTKVYVSAKGPGKEILLSPAGGFELVRFLSK